MKQVKKVPGKKLENFSVIFMQLGLVLVLFVVFISLEYKTEQKELVMNNSVDNGEVVHIMDLDRPFVYRKEVEVVQKPKRQQQVVVLDEIIPVEENTEVVEASIVSDPVDDVKEIDIDTVVTVDVPEDIDEEDDPKPIVMNLATKIPVFKGCENLSKKESRKCLDKKIGKLINKHFNTNLANELGLKEGKHKMYTQFVIDKTGKVVDVKVGTKHKRLESEAKRVVGKIPDFTPGESNGKKVSVKYTLPINFYVE